jgi:hypothetical protein
MECFPPTIRLPAVLDLHRLPTPMERIKDQNLACGTPGIVTLSRPAPANPPGGGDRPKLHWI